MPPQNMRVWARQFLELENRLASRACHNGQWSYRMGFGPNSEPLLVAINPKALLPAMYIPVLPAGDLNLGRDYLESKLAEAIRKMELDIIKIDAQTKATNN